MPRLQHQTRRDGGITVGKTRYELDSEGCVDVPEEHAAKLSQGAKWRPEGHWKAWERKITSSTPPIVAGARRARTRAELLGMAEAEGVSGATEALASESEPEAAPAPEPKMATEVGDEPEAGEIEIGMHMPKPELAAVAEQLEINVDGMTKAQIIEAIMASQQE